MTIIEQLEKRKKLLAYLNSPSNEEIFTPAKLVEEMLDKLPKEIWTDPNLLWCDPCAKSGVFMLEVVLRLMKNIAIENETERYKHIINNMVKAYVNVERNKWLVSKMVYGSKDSVNRVGIIKDINKINIEDMPKFDVVVGNPPFQKSTESKHKIYPAFINKSFDVCKDNGYVSLISPLPAIDMLLGRTASQVSFKHNFKNIKYLAVGTPKKYFNVGDTFCYFVVKNENVKESDTIIECYDINKSIINFNTVLRKNSFVSQVNNSIINSILHKLLSNNNEFQRSVSRIIDDKKHGTTKIIQKLTNNNFIFAYTDIFHEDSKKSKIIFGISGNKYLIVKENENIMNGSSACAYVITKDENESNNIIKFLDSKLVTFVMQYCFNQIQNKYYYALQWFKKPILCDIFNINNIYKFYGLTQEEIDYIESQVK